MDVTAFKTDLSIANRLSYLLEGYATGEIGNECNDEFVQLRVALLSNQTLNTMLPDWLKGHRSLKSFWGFISKEFESYAERRAFLSEEFAEAFNYLEFGETTTPNPAPTVNNIQPVTKNKVFIVHGRDNEAKQEIARFIQKIGLTPIILHEQASIGKTIIEKFEHYSEEIGYAVVLYTACDHGRGIHEATSQPRERARQNVVFEHGYLMAKLGRENVCALVKGDIETPNDISGVVYIELDFAGAWKSGITKELRAKGYNI